METDELERLLADPGLRAIVASSEWTEAQAQRVVQALSRSGLSVKDFSARLGMHSWRLYQWRQRLRSQGTAGGARDSPATPEVPAPFVSVRLAPPPTVEAAWSKTVAVVQHPSGLKIRFYRPLPETVWQRQLDILVPPC